MAMVLLRERLGMRRLLGALLGLGGAALAILHRPVAQLVEAGVGDGLVMLAVLVFCLGAVLTQRLVREMDAVVLTILVHAIGAAALLGHAGLAWVWSGEPPHAPPAGWLWAGLLLSGVLSAGIGNLLWTRSISLIGMVRASQWPPPQFFWGSRSPGGTWSVWCWCWRGLGWDLSAREFFGEPLA